MKPVSVRFRCFGPYISEQTIRFDKLAEYGLFLICGETGSGKTTILDAICCALYGSCSGDIRGELDAMRCKQATLEDPTEVEFIFESGGKKYCFRRKLIPRKKRKAETETTFNEDYSCCVDIDGQWVPLLDNCKKKNMNAKAAEVIGLTLEQFRQVIILPQGKFETLLTSKSEDKETILSSLFHTERWKNAVEKMADELNERRDAISRENQTILDALKKLEISTVAELPETVQIAAKAKKAAVAEEENAKVEKERAKAVLALSEEFIELDKRQEKLQDVKKAAEEDHDLQVRLEMAAKAENARKPHDEWEQAKIALSQAEKQVNEAEEQLTQAEEAKKKAEREQTAHLALVSEQNEREKELARLSALRSQYTDMETLQKNANAAKDVMDGAKKTRQDAINSVATELEILKQLEAAWNNAEQEYKSLSDAYKAVAIGHLAASLQEGEPCPVCGNRHHPCPAILPEGAVTAKNVEDAEKKVGEARKAFIDQKTVKENAEGVQKEADSAFQNAKSEYDKADGALNNALSQRDPEINTLQELDERCEKLKGLIREYNDKKISLYEVYTQANIDFGTKEGALKDRRKNKDDTFTEYTEKETAWKRALEETGLGTETQYNAMVMSVGAQNELRTTLANHEAARKSADDAVKEQLAKLEGKIRPDVESAERVFAEAEEKYNDAISARTIAVQKYENLDKEAKQLIDLDLRIADRRKAYEDDSAFVRALRGSVGMSIQRYVLSVRLNQVIVEANRLLQGIYGGRYRLHRSNESYGSSHKSGLELEVYDSMNDQQRSVCTLSGGEKFLVALSLAIGLCTVVQNEQKGVNLEAMFIDEGFGSLDQSSLGDALDILQGVRRGRGLVGIISHIPMLEETIPTKIIIKKTAHGSVKKEVYG